MEPIAVALSADVREGEIHVVRAAGTRILLTRVNGVPFALEDRCSHLGWSMARGTVSGTTLRCPWHGSEFDVRNGDNLDWVNGFAGVSMPRWACRLVALGKKPVPLRTFTAIEESGRILITDSN